MRARVIVYRDGKMELNVPVSEAGVGIGRDAANALQLSSPEVSKQHAFLHRTPAGWRVMDLESKNGVLVNDLKVQDTILKSGDRLSIGPYTLVFELSDGGEPFKPLRHLDLSENAAQQTMPAQRRT